jgi:hypothetical protein
MKHLLVRLAISLSISPLAFGAVSAGVSLGYQPYETGDAARLTPGAEVTATFGRLGFQAAGEYTNRSYLGKVTALHVNAIYIARASANMNASFGAGLTRVDAEATEQGNATETTWNLSAELSRKLNSAELFARVRYFTYEFPGFRDQGSGSPAGPSVSVGVRYWFRR